MRSDASPRCSRCDRTAIFTAVIQPPLILFVAVPTAYFLFHGGQITGHQGHADQLRLSAHRAIPGDVLHVGGRAADRDGALVLRDVDATCRAGVRRQRSRRAAGLASKMSSLLSREPADEDDADADNRDPAPQAHHRPAEPSGQGGQHPLRPTRQTRHAVAIAARPPAGHRNHRTRRRTSAPASLNPADRVAAARRATAPATRIVDGTRKAVPPPAERRTGYDRPERRRRYDDYESLEPHGTNGNGTHHPVSRVRYRGDADDADEPRAEYRTRRAIARADRRTRQLGIRHLTAARAGSDLRPRPRALNCRRR